MTRSTFAAKFTSHNAAAEYAELNGWTLETTEPMENGVWANFTSPRDFTAEIVAEHDALTKPAAPATATTYTFHRAANDQIIETAKAGTLQAKAAHLAARIHKGIENGSDRTTAIYVHNGTEVIAAGLCNQGLWQDTSHDRYRQFDQQARELRTAAGLANK